MIIKTNYCEGCQVIFQQDFDKPHTVIIYDGDTELLKTTTLDRVVRYIPTESASENYSFRNYRVEVFLDDELIFSEKMNLESKNVKINFDSNALGDTLVWMPYVDEFQRKHNCNVYVNSKFKSLYENVYPNLKFFDAPKSESKSITIIPGLDSMSCKNFYCFYSPCNCYHASFDLGFYSTVPKFRTMNFCDIACDILGLERQELKAKFHIESTLPKHNKPYVCIAVQSTAQYKYWNNPEGWQQVADFLKEKRYDVVCVDKEDNVGKDGWVNSAPKGIINLSGDLPLNEACQWIANCEFMIGLSSGLTWMAWAMGKKTVMISGYTKPYTEYENPYRVVNTSVCYGCWNDLTVTPHNKMGWDYCPHNKNYECSKEISSEMVIGKINQLIEDLNMTQPSL